MPAESETSTRPLTRTTSRTPTARPLESRRSIVTRSEVSCSAHSLTASTSARALVFVDRISELVRALPKPCVATLGNHDHWTDARRIAKALERGGAHVLRNESLVIDRLPIVGVDDGCSGHADVVRAFEDVADPEHALVLTGHTHAGQLHVPRVTERLARLVGHRYLHGFYRLGVRTDLYVNAGIGHAALRAGRARPEIAVFDLGPSLPQPEARSV